MPTNSSSSATLSPPIDSSDLDLYSVQTHAKGPDGSLPFDADFLLNSPSGDIFGLSQNAGMGWDSRFLRQPEFLILSTQGGIRAPDGTPHRTGVSHRALGSWALDAGRRGGIQAAGDHSLCRLRHRSM